MYFARYLIRPSNLFNDETILTNITWFRSDPIQVHLRYQTGIHLIFGVRIIRKEASAKSMAENIRLPEPVKQPSDWKKFKTAFQFYLTASEKEKKSEQVKIALLINCIGEDHIETYNTFEIDLTSAKLTDVITKFESHFEPLVNVVYERYCFRTRKQQEGESIEKYLTALKTLALSCNYTDKDDQIRDTLVCGTRDPASVEKLLREPKLTLKTAEQFLRAKELSEDQAKQINAGTTNSHKVLSSDLVVKSQEFRRELPRDVVSSKRLCIRCNLRHAYRNCPAFGKKCTYCDKMNHFEVVCQSKKADEGIKDDSKPFQRNCHKKGAWAEDWSGVNTLEVDDEQWIHLNSVQQLNEASVISNSVSELSLIHI